MRWFIDDVEKSNCFHVDVNVDNFVNTKSTYIFFSILSVPKHLEWPCNSVGTGRCWTDVDQQEGGGRMIVGGQFSGIGVLDRLNERCRCLCLVVQHRGVAWELQFIVKVKDINVARLSSLWRWQRAPLVLVHVFNLFVRYGDIV